MRTGLIGVCPCARTSKSSNRFSSTDDVPYTAVGFGWSLAVGQFRTAFVRTVRINERSRTTPKKNVRLCFHLKNVIFEHIPLMILLPLHGLLIAILS